MHPRKKMTALVDQAAEQDTAPAAIEIEDEATRSFSAWRTLRFALARVLAVLVDREGKNPELIEKLGATFSPAQLIEMIDVLSVDYLRRPLMLKHLRELAQKWEGIENGVCAEHPTGFGDCCRGLVSTLLEFEAYVRKDARQALLDHAAALLDDEAEVLLSSRSLPPGLREWSEPRFEEPFEKADGRLFNDLRTTARSLRTVACFEPRKEAL